MKTKITISVPEFLYQIALEAHLLGETDLAFDKESRAVALSQLDVEEPSYAEVIRRSLRRSDGLLRRKLYIYLGGDFPSEELSNVPSATLPEVYVYELRFPDNFHKPSLRLLQEGIHRYHVHQALWSWYMLRKDEEANRYQRLAEEDLVNLMRATTARVRSPRPTTPY